MTNGHHCNIHLKLYFYLLWERTMSNIKALVNGNVTADKWSHCPFGPFYLLTFAHQKLFFTLMEGLLGP